MARTYLVAHDFSEHADAAARVAAEDLQPHGGRLLVVHAYQFPAPLMPVGWVSTDFGYASYAELEEGLTDEARAKLEEVGEKLQQEVGDLTVETRIAAGPAAETIIEVANEEDVDRIVMGSHGWNAFERVLLGSVALRVVRLSERPVLVVKHPRDS